MTLACAVAVPAADHPMPAIARRPEEIEVERLEALFDAVAAELGASIPRWWASRGKRRVASRRRAHAAVQAMRMTAGALAQARHALRRQRRLEEALS